MYRSKMTSRERRLKLYKRMVFGNACKALPFGLGHNAIALWSLRRGKYDFVGGAGVHGGNDQLELLPFSGAPDHASPPPWCRCFSEQN